MFSSLSSPSAEDLKLRIPVFPETAVMTVYHGAVVEYTDTSTQTHHRNDSAYYIHRILRTLLIPTKKSGQEAAAQPQGELKHFRADHPRSCEAVPANVKELDLLATMPVDSSRQEAKNDNLLDYATSILKNVLGRYCRVYDAPFQE